MRSNSIFPIVFCFVLVLCCSGVARAQAIYGYSVIVWDDDAPQRVSGLAGTEIDDYTAYYYDAWVHSCLWRPVTEQCMSEGDLYGNPYIDGYHPTFYAISNETYCVDSLHGLADFWYNYYYFSTGVCHTFPVPPDPSPTPTPTCEPGLFGNSPPPCQDPTPLPSPSASIEQIQVVEKYGTADIRVSTFNNLGGTTKFTIKNPTIGTGEARFAVNDSTEIVVPDNVTNQALTVKGVTESSQVDTITIEATMNNRPTIMAHDDFTVAVISSLVFEKFDSSYVDLEANPGNGQTGSAVGQRIFPDKKDAADVSTGPDRSLVKVKANVLPASANLKVYFGSFDLDDPSANGSPIDMSGADGKENNGHVNLSKSGDFTVPNGINCDGSSHSSGTSPEYVSKILCSTGSDGSATVIFKTTMQPGDNFAIAASMSSEYRNGMKVNTSNGSQVVNPAVSANPIHESGQPNPNNVAGIRTNMLTVWRKLHIEVDSMGEVTGNSVSGSLTDTKRVGRGNQTLNLSVTNLEENRFENGRLVIYPGTQFEKSLPVISASGGSTANTASSVSVNNTGTIFQISGGDQFVLFDDDNMDDSMGSLNGDETEDVPVPDTSLLTDNSSDPATNLFAPAYIVPQYDLANSQPNLPFVESPTYGDLTTILTSSSYFQNVGTEANSEFWTIYLAGGYQPPRYAFGSTTFIRDGDPLILTLSGDIATIYGATNSSSTEPPATPTIVRQNDATGSIMFAEVGRSNEYPSGYGSRPVSRAYTTVHEVGHLFRGVHADQGLMRPTADRTSGVFSDTSLSVIRQTVHP
jgi:hypothetical protein